MVQRSILALLLLGACAGPKVSRTIGAAQVGTAYARLTGYFATAKAAPGGRHEEDVPGHLQHDIILDEATLVKFAPAEVCFEVVVRSESQHDEPLEQLAPSCKVGSQRGSAIVAGETVTLMDYTYQGMQPVVEAQGIAASQYLGLSIERPADKVFRVVERRGTICCPGGDGSTVTLGLDNARREVADYNYKLAFEWTLR